MNILNEKRQRTIRRRVIIRDDDLRQPLALDIVRHHHRRVHPDDAIPIPKREGTIRHRSGLVLVKPGAWFAVTGRDVQKARARALRAGVTFATYMDFHLLRRNYEADPFDVRSGAWIKIRRDPPPAMSLALSLSWMRSGCALLDYVDERSRLEEAFGEDADAMQEEIIDLIADMCRPLRPRRRRRRLAAITMQAVSRMDDDARG